METGFEKIDSKRNPLNQSASRREERHDARDERSVLRDMHHERGRRTLPVMTNVRLDRPRSEPIMAVARRRPSGFSSHQRRHARSCSLRAIVVTTRLGLTRTDWARTQLRSPGITIRLPRRSPA